MITSLKYGSEMKNHKCINKHGNGDHKHTDAGEQPYAFTGLERLFADFEKDVREVLKNETGYQDRDKIR